MEPKNYVTKLFTKKPNYLIEHRYQIELAITLAVALLS